MFFCDVTSSIDTDFNSTVEIATAHVQVTLRQTTDALKPQEDEIFGRFAFTSPQYTVTGAPVHAQTHDGANHACTDVMNAPGNGSAWIAVVERGGCPFDTKLTSAKIANASAVIVYDNDDGFLVTMETTGE